MTTAIICYPNSLEEEIGVAREYAKTHSYFFISSFQEKSLADLLGESRKKTLPKKLVVVKRRDASTDFAERLETQAKNLGISLETKIYQEIIRPGFDEIKRFLEGAIEQNSLCNVDCIIGIYNGGAIPAIISKHYINKIRRCNGNNEIEIYPIKIRTTKNDAVCTNKQDNNVIVEYFIKPPLLKKHTHFLVIDDIISYGKTMAAALEKISDFCSENEISYQISVLSIIFNKERYLLDNKTVLPNFRYMLETRDHEWVVFPWEANLDQNLVIE